MANPFLGEIKLVPYNFAPRGWAFCAGQLVPISQYDALFSLLGTTYGGDGVTTFALPDLRGRAVVHQGSGPGLSNYQQGQAAGLESVTLTIGQIPSHAHALGVGTALGTQTSPAGHVPARAPMALGFAYDAESGGTMRPGSLGSTGGATPHSNMQPSLVLNYVIALEGVYPPRN